MELVWKYRIAGLAGLVMVAIYWAYFMPGLVSSPVILSLLIGVELLLVAIAAYRKVFFLVVMIAFLWAGAALPLKSVWGAGRWVVLVCAAVVGMTLWLKESRLHFGTIHLIAFLCVIAALASATVSAFPRTAFYKATSLLLLYMYATSGARFAILHKEWRFARELLLAAEVMVYVAAFCYFGIRFEVFGNPNSLGAVMGVAVVPLLAWGTLDADSTTQRRQRFFALLVGVALLLFSRSRAALLAASCSGAFLLLNLKSYRLFLRVAMVSIAGIALIGIWDPKLVSQSVDDVSLNVVYKGHREEGVLGSRREPWQATMATIREHPLFGGGFGTTQTGAENEKDASAVATSAGTFREHGNSYLALLEWVGLLGIAPFLLLLGGVLEEVRQVGRYMRRTLDCSHPAIPVAAVCLAGLVHAMFEDWLFAVGYYLSVFVWCLAFCLVDLTRGKIEAPRDAVLRGPSWPSNAAAFPVADRAGL